MILNSILNDVWNHFYSGFNQTDHITDTILENKVGNFHVHEVLFTNHSARLINLNDNYSNRLLVSYCVFDSNQGYGGYGGNIYQNQGQCVQYRICCIKASTNCEGPHSYIDTSKNYMIESTLTGCRGDYGTIVHGYVALLQNINISNSNTYYFSGYSISSNSNIIYSTFYNNEARVSACLSHYLGEHNLKYCNILSNKCNRQSEVHNGIVLATNSKVYMDQCILQSNSGLSIFCTWAMSANDNPSITATKCYILSNSCKYTTDKRGYIEYATFSIRTTNSLKLDNSYIYTALCQSINPIIYLKDVKLDKAKYTQNEDKSLKVIISFDSDTEEPFHIKIHIDEVEKYSKEDNQYEVDIPSNITIGSHKVYVTVSNTNSFDIKSSPVNVSVVFKITGPFTLNLDDLEQTSYKHNIDKIISIRGNGTFSGGDVKSIHCSISDIEVEIRYQIYSDATSNFYNFSGEISIPSNISQEQQYTLKVWSKFEEEISNVAIKQFEVYRNSPDLTVSNLIKDTYYHNKDKAILVSGSVSDADGDESVTIQSYIEGYESESLSSKSLSIQNSSNYQFSLNVNIPSSLTRGNHNIVVTCCDSTDKCVSSNKEFYFEYNNPVLKIVDKPNFPVVIKRDTFLNFTLNVSDIDGNSNIRIYHSLNNTVCNLVNISLEDETSKEFEYNIPVPSDINSGNFQLQFYSQDEHCLVSDIITMNISFIRLIYTQKFRLIRPMKRR